MTRRKTSGDRVNSIVSSNKRRLRCGGFDDASNESIFFPFLRIRFFLLDGIFNSEQVASYPLLAIVERRNIIRDFSSLLLHLYIFFCSFLLFLATVAAPLFLLLRLLSSTSEDRRNAY